MQFIEYPKITNCGGTPCDQLYSGQMTDEQKDSDPFLARFCLDIMIFKVAHWRICHFNKDEILRLRVHLVTQTVKLQSPKIDPDVMCKSYHL